MSSKKSWVVLLLTIAGQLQCGGDNAGDNENTNTNDNDNGVIDVGTSELRGLLSVTGLKDRITIIESEPNNAGDDTTGKEVESGTRVKVFGTVSEDDQTDMFRFNVDGPKIVSAILTFDFNPTDPSENNLAIGFIDLLNATCSFGVDDVDLTDCFDSEKNPERASFEVEDDFIIVVQALAGEAGYRLGIEIDDAISPSAKSRARMSDKQVGQPTSLGDFVPSEAVVRFGRQISAEQQLTVLADCGMSFVAQSPSGYNLVRLTKQAVGSQWARKLDTLRVISNLNKHAGVQAEPNYRYYAAREPNDELFALQWHYDLINLGEAWDITVGSEDIVIAVVDTGVLSEHPDFGDRLFDGYDFISDSSSARDGDGIDSDPNDEGDLSGGPGQSSFHGTHVAGTIGAATNNVTDIAGVTWSCRIMPVRALGVGGGSSFDIGEAIRYASGLENISGTRPARAASVINLSLASPAGSPPSSTMESAIIDAVSSGVAVVAAAGNQASALAAYPAAFDEAISVSAVDPQFALAPYSNFGSTIDIAGPGGNLSIDLTGDGFGDGVLSLIGVESAGTVQFTLSYQHGTSMASPHVAGVIGLMRSVNPDLTVDEVRNILADTATDVGDTGLDEFFGNGVVNAASAVNQAADQGGQPTPTEPRLSLSTNFLDFGNSIDELTVQVANTGAGALEVGEVTIEEIDGEGWLSVEVLESSGDSNVSAVTIIVDRTGLEDGRYLGRVFVPATDQDTEVIDISVDVGESSEFEETLFVVAIDAVTRLTVAQDETTFRDNFAYNITNLPAGVYKIYAGTDRDDDDQICDLGEICGGHPSAIEAQEVTVDEGESITDVDFAVGELIFEAQARQGLNTPVIKLLD